MSHPIPVANGIRTDHPYPGLPFVDDFALDLTDPEQIEKIGRGAGEGHWGRTDNFHTPGAWRAFTTHPEAPFWAWVVTHHPTNGTSVLLYKDDDAATAYGYRAFEPENGGVIPLVVRHGGYWSDGEQWRRPTAVLDPVTGNSLWDQPSQAHPVSATDTLTLSFQALSTAQEERTVYSMAEFARREPDFIPFSDWSAQSLKAWQDRRTSGSLPLDNCIVELRCPELMPDALLDNGQAAHLAKVAASTWRAYVSRGQAPEPQKVYRSTVTDASRPYWSQPIVEAWIARRDHQEEGREGIAASPSDPRTETVMERMSAALMRLGKRVVKAEGSGAVREVLRGKIIGLALHDHATSAMHAAWMLEDFDGEYLADVVIDQLLSLMWLDPRNAERTVQRFVRNGLDRGYKREKLEDAVLKHPRVLDEPEYVALVERAVKPQRA